MPDEVVAEVSRPEHRAALEAAITDSVLEQCSVDAIEASALILKLHDVLGAGELACLAIALENGWTIACDERRRFHKEAVARLGADRLIGTVEIYRLFIGQKLLSIAEADADKELLAANRFRMPFESFGQDIG